MKNIGLSFCWDKTTGIGKLDGERNVAVRGNIEEAEVIYLVLPVAFTLKNNCKNISRIKYFYFILFPLTTMFPSSLMVLVGLEYWW